MRYFSFPCPGGLRLQTKRAVPLGLQSQKIYWLSRHSPTQEQKKALLLLHGENLLIVMRDPYFRDLASFLAYLRPLNDGFVYVVAPRHYLKVASQAGHHFGEFCGYNDPIFGFELKCVFHYSYGYREYKLGACEVADSGLIEIPYYSSRLVSPLAV